MKILSKAWVAILAWLTATDPPVDPPVEPPLGPLCWADLPSHHPPAEERHGCHAQEIRRCS